MSILSLGRNRHYEAGIRYFDHDQYELAIRELEQVLSRGSSAAAPERKLALFYLGESYSSLGADYVRQQQYPAAEHAYTKALEINPSYADLHYELARVFFFTQQYERSESQVTEALRINPKYARAMYLEGLLLYRAGEWTGGFERIREAAELESAFSTSEIDRARKLHETGEHEQAFGLLCAVGEMPVDEVSDLIESARASLREGNLEHAQFLLNQALALAPEYPDVRNMLGQVWMARGEYLRAVNEFREALGANERFVAAHINLGIACRKMGSEDAARDAFSEALELDPENQEARELLSET